MQQRRDQFFEQPRQQRKIKRRKGQQRNGHPIAATGSLSDTTNKKNKRHSNEHSWRKDRYIEERANESVRRAERTLLFTHNTTAFGATNVEAAVEDAKNRAIAEANEMFVDLAASPPSDTLGGDVNDADPWFVLHIGPPKTATTTIQCGLERYSLRLAKADGYHFLGGGCGVPMQAYFMPNGEQTISRRLVILGLHAPPARNSTSENDQPVNDKIREVAEARAALEGFVDRSRFLRSKGRSVVLSGEQFGSQLSYRPPVMESVRKMLLSSDEDGAGFSPEKVRIVLAYRHFVDWLPSMHYQKYFCIDNEMDREWVLWGNPDPATTNRSRGGERGSVTGASRVEPFLDYAEAYLSSWEAHHIKIRARLAEAALSKPKNDTTVDVQQRRKLRQLETIMNDNKEEEKERLKQNVNRQRLPNGENKDHLEEPDNPLHLLPKNRRSIHPSWWLYRLWSSYFPLPNQVVVYDMHSPMNSNRPGDDMVTDFVCHMLPTAHRTCASLMAMEDKAQAPKDRKDDTQTHDDEDDERDYETPMLHSQYSLLFPNRTSERLGISNGSVAGGGSSSNSQGNHQGMTVRPSSDHHATRIVEELLMRGDIRRFDYEPFGPAYFERHDIANATAPEVVGGYTKSGLIRVTRELLLNHGVLDASSSTPSSSKKARFSEKYFDCMPKDLEDRLLEASLTFMDLMYKHTPMLALATEASAAHSSAAETVDAAGSHRNETELRWNQARDEHTRLFEKNKASGKYCDINPNKVFSELPELHADLEALSFKPNYRRFRYSELPKAMLPNVKTLKLTKLTWNARNKKTPLRSYQWKDLASEQKAAAFALGWDEESWKQYSTK